MVAHTGVAAGQACLLPRTLVLNGEWRSGSAPALGAGGRGFKSPLPDGDASNQIRRLERVTGIEPAFLAWKARALPLSYTRR